ncbi:hypothetical protein SETIT_8G211800v2 [Setaria italica]|uniref:laccase n=1 Tax=Setaria italica TaxID=4555 RepID=K3ZHT4_SETIT|nr:laccase-15 [Setaria italica]XP_022685021.1 laccase-15 [Setaria italica]RCV39294.1 hypothetical protein SETIT_8G211800v2 [Setaria italica]RCV39295.1 hypothetical protein SETIT_8G211800v2 [Setaria italica]
MDSRSLPVAATAALIFFSVIALSAGTAIVEHTFVVTQVTMTHLCKDTLVTVVNGQLPGPAIEVTEGDSIAVHVVNKSPFNLTIHWHGVRQLLNCWADGVPMITQRPILPDHNFTYRFDASGQEGTLWWHAHVPCLRATIHGILIIRPRHGAISYPFPKPHKEIPIIIGEWWDLEDLGQVDRHLRHYVADDYFKASTINAKLGDLYNCSGVVEEAYKLDLEPGKTYLLRVLNAALFSEYYLKIAGHKFIVVAGDANYVSPYTTDTIAIAPGQTFDALVVADASPGRYYMVAMPNQPPKPDYQSPVLPTRGVLQYSNGAGGNQPGDVPMSPEMPDNHNHMLSFYFHGNLTSLHHPRHLPVPKRIDERLFITLGLGSVCRQGQSCERGAESDEVIVVATMNNISYELPTVSRPLLEAHYQNPSNIDWLQELPDVPPRVFNFTDNSLIPTGPKEEQLEPTSKAALARRFRYGAVVDVVFQSTSMLQSESNPMHLHGHDMFVLAQGSGNYDMERDVAKYNLVNPPLVNTVLVPRLGWVAVRFIADNPGVWYMHCHFEFHQSMGMIALFIVEDGPTANTSLPSPPVDFLTYGDDNNLMPDEYYL